MSAEVLAAAKKAQQAIKAFELPGRRELGRRKDLFYPIRSVKVPTVEEAKKASYYDEQLGKAEQEVKRLEKMQSPDKEQLKKARDLLDFWNRVSAKHTEEIVKAGRRRKTLKKGSHRHPKKTRKAHRRS